MRLQLAGGLAAAIIAAAPALGADPPPLGRARLERGVRLAGRADGGVTAWDPGEGRFVRWAADGSFLDQCRLRDPRLQRRPAMLFAARGSQALVPFLQADPAGSRDSAQLWRAVVVDVEACRVERELAIPGVATSVAGLEGGWAVSLLTVPTELVGSGEPEDPPVVLLPDDGDEAEPVDLDRGLLHAAVEEAGAEEPGLPSRGAKVLATRKDVWVLPDAFYELIWPRQHGRAARVVVPPPCLQARGRAVEPEEGAKRLALIGRDSSLPESVRAHLASGARSKAFRAWVRGAAAGGGLAAVEVRDQGLEGGLRIDVWDLSEEAVVAVLPSPGSGKLVAVSEEGIWYRQGQRMLRLALPHGPLLPLQDPCTALKELRDGAPAAAAEPAAETGAADGS